MEEKKLLNEELENAVGGSKWVPCLEIFGSSANPITFEGLASDILAESEAADAVAGTASPVAGAAVLNEDMSTAATLAGGAAAVAESHGHHTH